MDQKYNQNQTEPDWQLWLHAFGNEKNWLTEPVAQVILLLNMHILSLF